MHHDLERQRFLDHIEMLRARLDLHEGNPKQERQRFAEMRTRLERLEADNAVLKARLATRVASAWIVEEPRKGCRQPQSGLGTLSYDQVAQLHRQQLDRRAIAAAAGVDASTVSRWRISNGYVAMHAPRVEACGSTSSEAPGCSPTLPADVAMPGAGALLDVAAGGAEVDALAGPDE